MSGGRKRLLDVRGFGEGKVRSLENAVGGWDSLEYMLRKGDVIGISSVEGISHRMAVELILAYGGDDPGSMLETDGAKDIYTRVLEKLGSYMMTPAGRNRTSLLVPSNNMEKAQYRSRKNHDLKELLRGVDREEVRSCLDSIGRKIRKDRISRLDYVLVVEDDEALERIRELSLDRSCMVVSPGELESGMEGDMVLVHNNREIDESILPIVSSVHFSSPPERIIPEMAMDPYSGRKTQLEALGKLEEMFSRKNIASKALDMLMEMEGLSASGNGPEEIMETVEEIRQEIEKSLKCGIEKLTLSGEETLSLLSSDEPPALREIYRDHARKAADMVLERFGRRTDLFTMSYPVKINEEALERMISDIEEQAAGERFRVKQDLAAELAGLWPEIEKEIAWATDLDFKFGMACFVDDLELRPFKNVDGWLGLHRACHLEIRGKRERQLVSYHLGKVPGYAGVMFPFRETSSSRTSLLTGANSGGKTTLLETVAQTVIMARMGLPVPADDAFLPEIRRLFYYKPRRRLDAGGLESFLKELLPMVLDVDQGSLVLADELEAMTELEAASRVIGVFIRELLERDAYSVIVTHMAREIMRFVNCRVDGIEARGLDTDHELIVDRTPRIGKHARSTPELILRKLEARSSGEKKEIYSRVLEGFDENFF